MIGLEGKVMVIAGASGHLGQAVTAACASAGAQLVVVSRHRPSHCRRMCWPCPAM